MKGRIGSFCEQRYTYITNRKKKKLLRFDRILNVLHNLLIRETLHYEVVIINLV